MRVKYPKRLRAYVTNLKKIIMKNLIIVFGDRKEFNKATKFFENKSLFSPDGYDEKENSIGFECDCGDADSLENEIKKELLHYGFFSYYFIFE